MKRRNFLFAVAAAATLAQAAPALAQAKIEKPSLVLGVGGKSLLYYLPLTVAERKGFFKEEGLSVEINDFGGGAKSLQALVGGSVEAASGFEIHDMAMNGDVMTMSRLDGLDIPPSGSVMLSPGGKHLMFTGLKHGLKKGQRVAGTLIFDKAGPVKVEFDVEGIGAKGPTPAARQDGAMPGMDMN